MPVDIVISVAGEAVFAELNDSETALEIARKLPIETDFNTWGDEIYFSIPVKVGSENGKEIVQMGELGYWPPGNAFCIFYGATPGSTEDKIRPASPVNPIGFVKGDPKIFKTLVRKSNSIKLQQP
ncbi:MAG: hypothetical protein JXB48_05785 [Candidatus Latescibacteria bacterium]|nr:hypothetical protein [Candidatus Latescibacterota bacterium]